LRIDYDNPISLVVGPNLMTNIAAQASHRIAAMCGIPRSVHTDYCCGTIGRRD